ncbi:phage holin family protein [Sphingobacterium psychroaquaticum]|uniref:Bacteriophage holin family protein n=1 Tax=Sphingobacterium psychroaquaticum TaxID=561061 RepID=A0A1X7K5K0_9SPHI|nr:phage holin family protein [Sphingobacterium psychroaquaticum]SMG35498.1 Bacteriophage holin family protein [Sphingobacterium psychroaquaticum]
MDHIDRLLKTFEFEGWSGLTSSLFPSLKYSLTPLAISTSAISVITYKIFGLDVLATIAFVVVMVAEVFSGILASKVQKIDSSSLKMSRFSLKMACYLIMLFVSNAFAESFDGKGSSVGYWFFDWLHLFLAIHIATENIISIGENLGVISGKGKTYWIAQIQDKVNDLFKSSKSD